VKILVTLVKSSLVFVLVEGWRLPPFIFYGSLEERVAIATLHFYAVYNKKRVAMPPALIYLNNTFFNPLFPFSRTR
jgi:hypothetical protein